MNHEIAVRFYENKKYGRTYAKGAFHKAVFNATADLLDPKAKYLLDMFTYQHWCHRGRTDLDMQAIAVAESLLKHPPSDDLLASYIQRLDADGQKQAVLGFALMDLQEQVLTLVISDPVKDLDEIWQLPVKPCKTPAFNQNSPQLLATNADLR